MVGSPGRLLSGPRHSVSTMQVFACHHTHLVSHPVTHACERSSVERGKRMCMYERRSRLPSNIEVIEVYVGAELKAESGARTRISSSQNTAVRTRDRRVESARNSSRRGKVKSTASISRPQDFDVVGKDTLLIITAQAVTFASTHPMRQLQPQNTTFSPHRSTLIVSHHQTNKTQSRIPETYGVFFLPCLCVVGTD
jgi:hypothetical protein